MSTNSQGSAVIHSRPCVICRKRRVKCDRTRPCSNCFRSKQLCTYEGDDVGASVSLGRSSEIHNGIAPAADAGVLDRLARLEALMAAMMERGGGGSNNGNQGASPKDTTRDDTTVGTSLNNSFAEAPPQLRLPTFASSYNANTAPVGQILFQDGYSAYFDSQFWPGVISEVDDLRRLFSPPIEYEEMTSWLPQSSIGLESKLDLSSQHPTIEESNILCQLFFENVNPFTRIIHESSFGQALSQYRRGTFILPREFEALLFSIYLITVNSLRAEDVESTFLTKKDVLISRFQHATQTALSNVNYLKSDKIWTLVALLHYLTYLFHRNNHQDAIPLLGITVHLAQTMGHHRDPSHFPFSQWVHEIRRRIWNQISILDGQAIQSYGSAESILPPTTDTQPPKNANDEEWHPSRFAKPSTVPQNASGFKDMTFVLVMRKIADLIRSLVVNGDVREGEAMIRDMEIKLNEKYLRHLDPSLPSQSIIIAMTEIKLSSLRLRLLQQKTKLSKGKEKEKEKEKEREREKENPNKSSGETRNLILTTALNHLETIEYHIQTFTTTTTTTTTTPPPNNPNPKPKPKPTPNWSHILLPEIPWLATSILLTQTSHTTNKTDIQRARKLISTIFQRYGNEASSSLPMKGSRIWNLLVELRDQVYPLWKHQDCKALIASSIPPQNPNPNQMHDADFDFGAADYMMRDFIGGEEDRGGNLLGGAATGASSGNWGDGLMYDDPLDLSDLPHMPWLDTQMPF